MKTGPEYRTWSYACLVLFAACIIFMIVFIIVIIYDNYHVKDQITSINMLGNVLTNTSNNNQANDNIFKLS